MRALNWLIACAALLSGCATAADPPSVRPTHYVIRHLHTPAGERDPDLTAEGQRQAQLLAGWFGDAPPRAIYVTPYKRTGQSVARLAERLGLNPISYDPADTPALIARVRSGALPALIVGHSNTVPDIVEQLGGDRPGPLVHEDFGDIWVISADGQTGRFKFAEEPLG